MKFEALNPKFETNPNFPNSNIQNCLFRQTKVQRNGVLNFGDSDFQFVSYLDIDIRISSLAPCSVIS